MPIDIKRDEYAKLPKSQKELVVFDNLQAIKTSLCDFGLVQRKQQTQIDQNRFAGGAWLFLLTVALGFRKWIPILG